MTAGTVTGGTLAVPALAAGVEAAPAVSTLLGKAGAAASAGTGQAYVRGSDAVAQGGKALKELYQRNGPQILEGAGQVKDFMSGYGLPLGAPKVFAEGLGTGLGLLEHHGLSIRAGLGRIRTAWDEREHPRDPDTGEFITKVRTYNGQ